MKLEQFKLIEITKNKFDNIGLFLETEKSIISIRVNSKGHFFVQILNGEAEIEDNDERYHTKRLIIK